MSSRLRRGRTRTGSHETGGGGDWRLLRGGAVPRLFRFVARRRIAEPKEGFENVSEPDAIRPFHAGPFQGPDVLRARSVARHHAARVGLDARDDAQCGPAVDGLASGRAVQAHERQLKRVR